MARESRTGNVPTDCRPAIRSAVDYWLEISPPDGLPGRQHLDPIDIPKLLPCIRLVEVHGRPPRFKARLVGTMVVEFQGRDCTGQWLDEAYPDLPGSAMERDYLHVIETKQPHWKLGQPYLTREKDYRQLERVNLPLAHDGEHVDMIVCVFVFHHLSENTNDPALPLPSV